MKVRRLEIDNYNYRLTEFDLDGNVEVHEFDNPVHYARKRESIVFDYVFSSIDFDMIFLVEGHEPTIDQIRIKGVYDNKQKYLKHA